VFWTCYPDIAEHDVKLAFVGHVIIGYIALNEMGRFAYVFGHLTAKFCMDVRNENMRSLLAEVLCCGPLASPSPLALHLLLSKLLYRLLLTI